MLHFFCLVLLPTLLMVAATWDVLTFKIPNWLTLLTAALFFPMALATGLPLDGFAWHIAGGILLFAIGFVMFQFDLLGGGDAKMLAAAGLWFGMANIYSFITLAALAGLLQVSFMVALSFIMLSLDLADVSDKSKKLWSKLKFMTPNVPFGFAIALGGIVAFRNTWWVHALQ
ncbi:MAG: prepilin peptidase [Aestuariivirga sp.]